MDADEVRSHWTKRLVYTAGVHFLCEEAAAYWLVDLIASYQPYTQVKQEEFQVWRLTVAADRSATVTMTNGNDEAPIVSQQIPFTDYPEDAAELYCVLSPGCPAMVMLPCEY